MIELKSNKLVKEFGGTTALAGLSFEAKGRVISIVGPNGSGKSTLLSIMAGVRKPSSGRLFLNGFEPYRERSRALSLLSFSFEKPRFNLSVKVSDVLDSVRDSCSDSDEFQQLVGETGVSGYASRRLYELSSGQAQLLALIVSTVCRKHTTAILDEPLAHLDPRRQGIFAKLFSRRGNIVFTTHVLEEAESLSDYIVMLNNGRLAWAGSIEDLQSQPVYEVFVHRSKLEVFENKLASLGGRVILDLGVHVLVEGVGGRELYELVESNIIFGYRKAGLRRMLSSEY